MQAHAERDDALSSLQALERSDLAGVQNAAQDIALYEAAMMSCPHGFAYLMG